MNVIGITFDGEMKGYVVINDLKINEWLDPRDLSLDIVFRVTIEHKYGKDGFKKVKELYVYFPKEDMENISTDRHITREVRERLEKEVREREYELRRKISPLKGYIPPIITESVTFEVDGDRKRFNVQLLDYEFDEKTAERHIYFSLRCRKSIVPSDKTTSVKETSWDYSCIVEPYLVQTLKWSKEEFMPPFELLEIWLQIPKDIYSYLSAIDVRPMSNLENMFFLGKETAEKFRDAGQPLAREDTLCINWNFYNVSVSSLPEEIKVIHNPALSRKEDRFVDSFEKSPEDFILILRELLYTCELWTLDLGYIISAISDENIKIILDIFNTMIFQRYLKPMEQNLNMLVDKLENFRDLPFYVEFFSRYDIFYTLILCKKSEEYFSDHVLSKIERFQELKNPLDPDYIELMEELTDLSETTKKFNFYNAQEDKLRYRNDVLSKIDSMEKKWGRKLIHPDKYIFYVILTNWKNIVKKEYEEFAPKPEIEATIKTKNLTLADEAGVLLSVKNSGKGEARDVYARLLPGEDYDIVKEVSDIKTLLSGGGRSFEPELTIKPNKTKTVIYYEIYYADTLGKENSKRFEETIEFTKKEIEFQQIENPYVIGEVVRDKRMFFGREELMKLIIENFEGKYQINPIFLYGQRRTGKTSILYHLKEKLRDEFFPIFFSTLEIFGEKSFYQDLMEKIKKELGLNEIEVPNVEDDPFKKFNSEFYDKIKPNLGKKKLVLMIDEYQRIDQLIIEGHYSESVIDFLNALVQDGEIKFILAGSLYPDELKATKWAELMKFFTTVHVGLLKKEDAINLICEPVKGFMEYDGGGIEKIISLGGCHPYFTQLICHVMVEHHNHDKVNVIGYNSVINYLSTYFERGYNIFSDIIEKRNDIERKILFYINNLMGKKREITIHRSEIEMNLIENEEIMDKREIEKALSNLERREIIRKSTEHPDYYEFAIDIYRQWIKWNLTKG